MRRSLLVLAMVMGAVASAVGVGSGVSTAATYTCNSAMPQTTTAYDGIPGPNFWARMQCVAAAMGGYTGPIDGVMGTRSWQGVQRYMIGQRYYSGSLTGWRDVETTKGLQRWAGSNGYTGPVDGIIGPNTYRALAHDLNKWCFAPAPGGSWWCP